jgi:hypothetical protein
MPVRLDDCAYGGLISYPVIAGAIPSAGLVRSHRRQLELAPACTAAPKSELRCLFES